MQIRTLMMLLALAGLMAAGAVAAAQEATPPGGETVIEQEQPTQAEPGEGVIEQDDGGAQQPPAEGGDGPAKPTGKKKDPGILSFPLILMLGGLVLFWFWISRGKRKDRARRKDMLANLKKGDKVVSIGGIVGTVMDVKAEEVTVKVDEGSNVRMKFARWGIRGTGDVAKAENMQDAQKQQETGKKPAK